MEFYWIYIKPNSNIKRTDIEKKMDLALDWFRLNENNWIVYTSSTSSKWYFRLIDFIKPDGNLFITKIDITNKTGLMPKGFWNWLNTCRERHPPLAPKLVSKSDFDRRQ